MHEEETQKISQGDLPLQVHQHSDPLRQEYARAVALQVSVTQLRGIVNRHRISIETNYMPNLEKDALHAT